MTKLLVAVYDAPDMAATAVNELLERDVPKSDISVLMREDTRAEHFAVEPEIAGEKHRAKVQSVGFLVAGLSAAVIATVTGGAAVIAAGPLLSALTAIGIGATASGLAGILVALGMSEVDSTEFEKLIESGGVLVAVSADQPESERAKEALQVAGPRMIRSMEPAS